MDLVPYPSDVVEAYREQGFWRGKTLGSELVEAAEKHAGSVALITSDGTSTYGELFDDAAAFAGGCARATDLSVRDAVMFQMGNVRETIVSYLGCLLAGLKPVCTLPQHGLREIGLLAEHLDARGLIVQADFGRGQLRETARTLLERGTITDVIVARGGSLDGGHCYDDILSAGRDTPLSDLPFADLPLEDVAVFQLSGGTTGLPKVAPRLHEDYVYNSRAWAAALNYNQESVVLYPLPVMHNAGIALALQPAFLSGSAVVLSPSADVDTILDLLELHRPDVIPLVPPALAIRLLEHPRSDEADLTSLRDVVVGGQVLPVEVSEKLRDRLGIEVRQMFGMAEGMFTITPASSGEAVRHHTVGAPISPGDEVRIVRPGTDEPVELGEIGEFCARGPYTIRGYFKAGQHNTSAFDAEGFYHTGDLAREHEFEGQSFFSIEGRIKDVINRGVEKIHAEEVEGLIVRHSKVANAALVAMPDRVLGEKACAYLVMEPGAEPLTVGSLGEFLLGLGLARYKLPERVEIVLELPLSNVGKVSKKDLRADVEAKIENERP